ncbi:hypothetical protein BLJAPNOD_02874 [Ensifer sp. M14]|jgi:hypothetical protein|nr:hypothetical protein BLJAPNOD_02874 [Ensifer sp. M14]
MRIILLVIVASVMSILAFKYADGALGNSAIVATPEELTGG